MITVSCIAPKRLKGNHEFGTYEEFARWVIAARIVGVGGLNGMLCAVAENGHWHESTGRSSFKISGPGLGSSAKELAREIGAFKRTHYSNDPQKFVEFAKRLDDSSRRM